tara:strand:- start:109 stop:390 length:282 start_codon:yes stop_codon:yes gene_type:complete
MIDTDNVKGGYCSKQEMIFYLNAVEEVKRLRKLEAAVVGSWMRACDHRGPWHKALRYPCVELGYLTLDGHYFELSEEYQDMAKEWIREQDGED